MIVLSLVGPLPAGAQGASGWSEPINLSESNTASYYPDVAVDSAGHVYVVWGEYSSDHGGRPDMVMFRVWDGQTWSPANDIVRGGHLPQIAVDSLGRIHLLQIGPYNRAWAQHDPTNARSWTTGRNWAFRDPYWPDMAADGQDRIHVVFQDTWEYNEPRTIDNNNLCVSGCRGTFYTHSVDGGDNWSEPVQLDAPDLDAAEPRLAVDHAGHAYAVWSDTDAFEETVGVSFAYSEDGGETWGYPVQIATGDEGYGEPQIAVDSKGTIHVVWHLRLAEGRGNVAYVHSTDKGETWSQVEVLPVVWNGAYSLGLTVDSADTLHMVLPLAGGEYPLGIYHLQRPASAGWSSPSLVFQNPCNAGSADVELVIGEGNHLHAVWYDRQECELGWVGPSGRGEVYYSDAIVDAPSIPAQPLPPVLAPTATPSAGLAARPTQAAASPTSSATASPTAPGGECPAASEAAGNELVIGIGATVLAISVVAGVVVLWRRR